MFIMVGVFSGLFSLFFSRYFSATFLPPILLLLLGKMIEGVFWFSYENFFFIFLSFWLIFFLLNCKKNFSGPFFMVFFFILFVYFSVDNFLFFFMFFELSLMPTYYLVMSGGTPERMLAGKYLILYTFIGSVPLLISVLILGADSYKFMLTLKSFKFYFLTLAFLMKLPVFLFHLWLPKAHVEASTEGSMILAGILLKLGAFGLLVFCRYGGVNVELGVFFGLGGVLAGLFSLYQVDVKSLIAYSSVLHMGLFFIKSFYSNLYNFTGVVLMSVGHGFISACMFYILAVVYSLSGSRKIFFIGGSMSNNFPLMFFCALCLILNASAPLSMKFFGEYFLFLGLGVYLGVWSFSLMLMVSLIGGLLSMYLFLLLFHGSVPSFSFKVPLQKTCLMFILKIFSVLFFILF